jgi:hypothetical protein
MRVQIIIVFMPLHFNDSCAMQQACTNDKEHHIKCQTLHAKGRWLTTSLVMISYLIMRSSATARTARCPRHAG